MQKIYVFFWIQIRKVDKTKKTKFPKTFLDAYPESETTVVSRENFHAFVGLT